MKFCALSSGSSGNSFYIENNYEAILIDAGISTKKLVERLALINRTPLNIRGIFITHEHSDHIRGTDVLARKFKIPIFANQRTIEFTNLCSDNSLINKISNEEIIKIAGMEVIPIKKFHKAIDPVFFTITNGKTISVITDLGYPCKNVLDSISSSDLLCIESNHDIEMLENGHYPYFLKKWIKSDIGHLSNEQSVNSVIETARTRLKNIVLSHLSENNNTPTTALQCYRQLKRKKDFSPEIIVSTKETATRLITI